MKPCLYCTTPTRNVDQTCDRCWEIQRHVVNDADLVRRILDGHAIEEWRRS